MLLEPGAVSDRPPTGPSDLGEVPLQRARIDLGEATAEGHRLVLGAAEVDQLTAKLQDPAILDRQTQSERSGDQGLPIPGDVGPTHAEVANRDLCLGVFVDEDPTNQIHRLAWKGARLRVVGGG